MGQGNRRGSATYGWPAMAHPLAAVLDEAAAGRFPPADGGVEILPVDADGTVAVVAFTGHAYVLADVDGTELDARLPDDAAAGFGDAAAGFGGALHPRVLTWLGRGRDIGSTDVVLIAAATGRGAGAPLVGGDPRREHGRVARAVVHRREVEVYGGDVGVVVVGRGLAGRRELSVELFDPAVSAGAGRRLIAAGLDAVPVGDWCWAQVAAGNARSLRAFLAAGFVPVCAEVLITAPSGVP